MLNEATLQFIREHRSDNVQQLALQFNPAQDSRIDSIAAFTQIAGKQAIAHKIPFWYEQEELLYPPRLSLEQCSSEATARYKASLLSGNSFVDLTGGWGVDTAFIAPKFAQAVYVERQAELVAIARHNFAQLGLNQIQTHHADGIEFLKTLEPVDCLYVDPARRSSTGKKNRRIEDAEPNIIAFLDLLLAKAATVLIKLSPMLDIHAALKKLKQVKQIHIVGVDNECKELLFLLRSDFTGEPAIVCVNIHKQDIQSDQLTLAEEKNACISYTSDLKAYLYEPNASWLKSGCYKSVGLRYAVEKLHPDSHLYTSSQYKPNFPGRIFQVEAVSSFNKKELKTMLRNVRQANISIRNFPLTVDRLRKQLKIKEGGEVYLFVTTLSNGRCVLIKAHR
jgi:16S rRNA G966 N2-methylase RsmD